MTLLFFLNLFCTPERDGSLTRYVCQREAQACSVWVDEKRDWAWTDCEVEDE